MLRLSILINCWMFDKEKRSTFKQIVNDLESIYFDAQNLAKYSSIFKVYMF